MKHSETFLCEMRTYNEVQKVHTYLYGHLLFPMHGGFAIQTKDQSAVMTDRHALFLPPACEHGFFAQSGYTRCLVVDIPADLSPAAYGPERLAGRILTLDGDWRAIRTLLFSESQKTCPSVRPLLDYSFGLLRADAEPLSLRYLRQHYAESVTVEALAAMEHFSPSYYTQWFTRQVGSSPRQYLQSLRVAQAKRLLETTGYSLDMIAQAVGYRHQSSLTRAFEQCEHQSPHAYRSRNR